FRAGHGRFLSSEAEVAFAAERPVDAAAASGDAGDVLAELVFDLAGPGNELEAAPAVRGDAFDHGEAAGGERELTAIGAGDIFASLRLHMRQAGLGRELVAHRVEFAPAQRRQKIALQNDTLA